MLARCLQHTPCCTELLRVGFSVQSLVGAPVSTATAAATPVTPINAPSHLQRLATAAGNEPSIRTVKHPQERQVIYKGRWILPFRLLVRGKVFQLLAASGAALAATTVLFKEDATALEIAGVMGLGAGCIVASLSLWYFSRRYVGELSLLPPDYAVAQFSVLDFWGNREDVDVALQRIQPPFKGKHPLVVRRISSQMAFPITVAGERQFFLSVRGGEAVNKEVLMKLLEGQLPGQTGQNDRETS